MKKLLLKILFFLYRKEYEKPLSQHEIDMLLGKLANTQGLENLPVYLEQCSRNAQTRYLYTKDEILKGTILAFVSLKNQIENHKAKGDKQLTTEEEVSIMRGRGY